MGATPHRGARACHYRGLSCRGAQAPDAQAQQLWLTGLVATWDLPRPGHEPVSRALAGRLSTTAPPGKPGLLVLSHMWNRYTFGDLLEGNKSSILPGEFTGCPGQIHNETIFARIFFKILTLRQTSYGTLSILKIPG